MSEHNWPEMKLSRRSPAYEPQSLQRFPNCACGCQNESETYLPKSRADQLAAERDAYREALEEIESFEGIAPIGTMKGIASAALANYRKGERHG